MQICKTLKVKIRSSFKALDIPKFHKLNISSIEEWKKDYYDEYFDGAQLIPAIELPHSIIIDGFDEFNNHFYLAINIEKERIEAGSFPIIFGYHKNDIYSVKDLIPQIITLPLWAPFNLGINIFSKMVGINHHWLIFYFKIRDQIPFNWRGLVYRSFSKELKQ